MDEDLARLTEKVNNLQKCREEDHSAIQEIRAAVQRMEVKIATFRFCEAPNSCLQLVARVAAVEQSLKTISDYVQQVRGAGFLAKVGWPLISFVAGGLLTYYIKAHVKP